MRGTVDFKENTAGNEGTVKLYIDDGNDGSLWYLQGTKAYEGSEPISWTWEEITDYIINAGTLAQGEHNLQVVAVSANGTSANAFYTITIDNTPTVSITASGDDGPIDVHGTVDFKENTAGNEGTIKLYIDYGNDGSLWYLQGTKAYEGSEPISWTWEEITDYIINAGTLAQGEHNLQVVAVSANGTSANAFYTITIDNTPEPVIIGSKYFPDDTFDIVGTTTFKENLTGDEGTIKLYIKEISARSFTQHGSTLSYEGKKISWKYSDFTGTRLAKAVWGQKEILVMEVATAANGTSKSVVKGMIIPALGCPAGF